jgi:predicted ATP-grasp superfamily ATP-dependent carboligase
MISPTLEQLSALIFADATLTKTLQEITDPEAFTEAVLAFAAKSGLNISTLDLQNQQNHNARTWLERWL